MRDKDGYVVISRRVGGTALRLHAAVLRAWVGAPAGRQCRHLDGNKANNALTNLCWGTLAENVEDKRKHGAHAGAKNSAAKLSEGFVLKLRAAAAHKPYSVLVAENPQYSKFAIWAAITGYTWAHLPGAIPNRRRCTKRGWKAGVRLRKT